MWGKIGEREYHIEAFDEDGTFIRHDCLTVPVHKGKVKTQRIAPHLVAFEEFRSFLNNYQDPPNIEGDGDGRWVVVEEDGTEVLIEEVDDVYVEDVMDTDYVHPNSKTFDDPNLEISEELQAQLREMGLRARAYITMDDLDEFQDSPEVWDDKEAYEERRREFETGELFYIGVSGVVLRDGEDIGGGGCAGVACDESLEYITEFAESAIREVIADEREKALAEERKRLDIYRPL